jgi:type II secretory pathway pseudopilin PulG
MRRGRKRAGGFTLLEVMIAVGLMTGGALAIMAMQQASTRGNMAARQVDTATNVTSRWVERLRRDALAWTRPGTSTQELGGSSIISTLGAKPTTDYFLAPAPAGDLETTPGFDWLGLPTRNAAQTRYCTLLRLTWVRQGALMRADVLTWWHRRGAGGDTTISDPASFTCTDADVSEVVADLASSETVLRAVRASAVLRHTPRQR